MDEQEMVATFLRENDMEAPPAYRLLDLVSEVGEVAKGATESTDYGAAPAEVRVDADEIGDVLFSLLALAESLDVDAGEALAVAVAKYEERLSERGSASSGR
ncbi:MAG: MazG nucleotide pyrophosphohydrolase domain-containing protein [Halobacteriaceae archaeon]